jgi:hypothetical protein
MKTFKLMAGILAVIGIGANASAATGHQRLSLSYTQLQQFNVDQTLTSEAYPQGVPTSYSWGARPAMQSGNTIPSGFTAITGWGQIFWANGVSSSPDYIQMQSFMTLICTVSNGAHKWSLLQGGDVSGSEFNSDFVGNINTPPPYFAQSSGSGIATVGIDAGNRVFHYWYKQGRVPLPSTAICGTLTIQQARTVTKASDGTSPGSSGAYVISLGGDYWLNTTAAWDQYTTNKGINIGRFKLINGQWQWFGVSTATDTDLLTLYQNGYTTSTNTTNTSSTTASVTNPVKIKTVY